MYAIFEDGSHQYRVTKGDRLEVEYRKDLKAGETVRFEKVLAAGNSSTSSIGRPVLEGAVVQGEIVDAEFRARKIEVGKFKRRKGYIRHNGHIQLHTQIRITDISVPGLVDDTPAQESAPASAPETAAV